MTTKNLPSELEKLKDKSFTLKLTILKKDVQTKYQQVLQSFTKELKIDGFRPGKIPADVAQQHLSSEKILEETFSQLASDLYNQKVKQYQLLPISRPKVTINHPPLSLENDWQFEIQACELPEITLDPKLTDLVKKTNQSVVAAKPPADKNQTLNKILEVIIKTSKLDLPEILLADEIEHKMSHLVDQVQQAGLSVNQYLKSKNLNLDQYQTSLKQQITEEWTINLAVSKIAADQKLAPTDTELNDLINKTPNLTDNRNLAVYILTQQKVFDYLQKL